MPTARACLALFRGPYEGPLIGAVSGAACGLLHDAVDVCKLDEIELRW